MAVAAASRARLHPAPAGVCDLGGAFDRAQRGALSEPPVGPKRALAAVRRRGRRCAHPAADRYRAADPGAAERVDGPPRLAARAPGRSATTRRISLPRLQDPLARRAGRPGRGLPPPPVPARRSGGPGAQALAGGARRSRSRRYRGAASARRRPRLPGARPRSTVRPRTGAPDRALRASGQGRP